MSKFKMKGFSKHQTTDLTKKPVGPRAKKKEVKDDRVTVGKAFMGGDIKLDPGYEDPAKIQKVQREGVTPHSQKMSKIAKEKAKSKKYKKYSDLEKHDDDR